LFSLTIYLFREFLNDKFASNLTYFTEYIKTAHPEFYKKLQGQASIKQTFEKLRQNVRKLEPKRTTSQAEIVDIIKERFKNVEIRENVLEGDGVIEYDIIIKNLKTNKEFAIEIFGPSHFKTNTDPIISPSSRLGLRLKRKYHSVIIIPFFELNELRTYSEKADYIEFLLKPVLH